jgi:hypothetical protein
MGKDKGSSLSRVGKNSAKVSARMDKAVKSVNTKIGGKK